MFTQAEVADAREKWSGWQFCGAKERQEGQKEARFYARRA